MTSDRVLRVVGGRWWRDFSPRETGPWYGAKGASATFPPRFRCPTNLEHPGQRYAARRVEFAMAGSVMTWRGDVKSLFSSAPFPFFFAPSSENIEKNITLSPLLCLIKEESREQRDSTSPQKKFDERVLVFCLRGGRRGKKKNRFHSRKVWRRRRRGGSGDTGTDNGNSIFSFIFATKGPEFQGTY